MVLYEPQFKEMFNRFTRIHLKTCMHKWWPTLFLFFDLKIDNFLLRVLKNVTLFLQQRHGRKWANLTIKNDNIFFIFNQITIKAKMSRHKTLQMEDKMKLQKGQKRTNYKKVKEIKSWRAYLYILWSSMKNTGKLLKELS